MTGPITTAGTHDQPGDDEVSAASWGGSLLRHGVAVVAIVLCTVVALFGMDAGGFEPAWTRITEALAVSPLDLPQTQWFLLAGVLWLGLAVFGSAFVGLIAPEEPTGLELGAYGAAAGTAIGSIVYLIVGSTLGTAPEVAIGTVAVLAAIGAALHVHAGRHRRLGNVRWRWPQWSTIGFFALVTVQLLFSFLDVLEPEKNWDAKWYHLGPVAHYVSDGRIFNIVKDTRLGISGNPMGQESLLTLFYSPGGMTAAKAVTFFMVLTVIGLVFAIGRRAGVPRVVMRTTAVVLLALPVMTWLASTAYVDLPLAMYSSAAFGFAVLAVRARSLRWALLSGFMVGAAISVKWFGLFTGAGIALAMVIELTVAQDQGDDEDVGIRHRWRRSVRPLLALAGGTAVLAVPVLIHNAIRTGNPMYPLANGLFRSPYWNEAAADHLSDFGLGARSILDGLWLAVIAPLSWSLDAVRHRALYGLAPALLLILFLVTIPLRSRTTDRVLARMALVFTVVYVLGWARVGLDNTRYIVGCAIPAVLVVVMALDSVRRERRDLLSFAIVAALVLVVVSGSQPGGTVLAGSSPDDTSGLLDLSWRYLDGSADRDSVQLRWMPEVRAVNDLATSEDLVYDAGHLIRNLSYIVPNVYNGSEYEGPSGMGEWTLCSPDAPQRLAAAGVDYIFIIDRFDDALHRSPIADLLTEVARDEVAGFTVYRFDSSSVTGRPDTSPTYCDFYGAEPAMSGTD